MLGTLYVLIYYRFSCFILIAFFRSAHARYVNCRCVSRFCVQNEELMQGAVTDIATNDCFRGRPRHVQAPWHTTWGTSTSMFALLLASTSRPHFTTSVPCLSLHLPANLCIVHRRAPSLITSRDHPKAREALWADAVDAVVAPATAFGGAGVLSLAEQVRQ